MTRKYFGWWSSHDEFKRDWSDCDLSPDGLAEDTEILFASYGGGSYEGDALVLFERDGKLYEVQGSHCSCNGLEGQWNPIEITWAALHLRVEADAKRHWPDRWLQYHDDDPDARERFVALVKANI